jgi:hypothetical protein
MQSWHGTWRETYLLHTQRRYTAGSHKPLPVRGLYSDLLHQPWLCASMDMEPSWLEVENIDRCKRGCWSGGKYVCWGGGR